MPSRPQHGQGPHVELVDIGKSFGGVRALDGISLRIEKGSIHALVGENGAGKSTLGKILAGVIAPDRGQLLIGGEPVAFRSPREAIVRGIVLIAQELSIAPALSVAENVFLGTEPRRAGFVARRALRRRYDELAAAAGFELSGDLPGRGLRTADQQKVEILRALCRDARLIVMDEPTAALPRSDADRLYQVVRRLAAGGTTIVLVSHFLREVAELADEVTILRDGHLVRTAPAVDETEETMLSSMLGRSLGTAFPARRPVPAQAPIVLQARGLSAPGVHDVSLDVRAGEILGLAGLVGSGRTELARALCRAQRVTAGTVSVAGAPLTGQGPWGALRAGLAMIPESRKEQGLMLGRPIAENVSLSSLTRLSDLGLVRRRAERQAVARVLGQVGVGVPAQAAPVSTLSGGNQQKALFARILLRGPRVLVADEPTRGVDVGAKRAIYELLTSLAAEGLGVLLISSDAEEILGLAHRVLVMRAGRIAAELRGEAMTEAAILAAAFGAPDAGTKRGA
ncbi:MAG TPA: sugar ABC transporter ATP-binding protein [Streptosporangiaceae bacterium]|nr:sugar ABC transporter ATP-binding protein [Streptosporangiaceae bacterium]